MGSLGASWPLTARCHACDPRARAQGLQSGGFQSGCCHCFLHNAKRCTLVSHTTLAWHVAWQCSVSMASHAALACLWPTDQQVPRQCLSPGSGLESGFPGPLPPGVWVSGGPSLVGSWSPQPFLSSAVGSHSCFLIILESLV